MEATTDGAGLPMPVRAVSVCSLPRVVLLLRPFSHFDWGILEGRLDGSLLEAQLSMRLL